MMEIERNNETKTEINGVTYTKKSLDCKLNWMRNVEYWFFCDEPKDNLTLLGVESISDPDNQHNMCYFKETGTDTYYKLRTKYCPYGWDSSYEGRWAWVSGTQPYPSAPINATWKIAPDEDVAYLQDRCPIERVQYYMCDKPSGELKKLGSWRVGKCSSLGAKYSDLYIKMDFYGDGTQIYRCVSDSENKLEPEWYVRTGREWPGRTDGSCSGDNHLVNGVIATGMVTLVTGTKFSGKTHLIGQLCTCVSNGIPFLGMDTRPAMTLHLNYDMTESQFGEVYGHINNFYGDKMVTSAYVSSEKAPLTSMITIDDVLHNIELHCINNRFVRLIAIDSIDFFKLHTYNEVGYFIQELKKLAYKYKVAIVYSCSSMEYQTDAVSLAYECADNELHAEMPRLLIGIIQDSNDYEHCSVHSKNDFDVDLRVQCKKSKDTHYCFDVQ